jgi:hypothetical protein
MKNLKFKLILLGTLLLTSFLVIGNFRFSSITYPALLIYIPFLSYTTLPFDKSRLIQIFLAVIGFCCIILGCIFLLRFVLCGYGERQNEYVNRKNKNIKIVGRDFSCFGTTGDLVLYQEYSLTDNIKIEFYFKTFPDYKKVNVDTTKWKRIEK